MPRAPRALRRSSTANAGSPDPSSDAVTERRPSRLAELLESLGSPADAASARELRAFGFLVLLHATVQSWAWVVVPLEGLFGLPWLGVLTTSTVLTICSGLALTRYGRWAAMLAVPALLCQLYWTFPWTPNHNALVFLCALSCAALNPTDDDERRLLLGSLRWITVIVFFYAGLQKVLYGYWFRGEFLSWMIGQGVDNWRSTFGWLVPDSELDRLRSLNPLAAGAGPYRVDSLAFIAVSNAVYLAEIAIAVLLLTRRFRAVAATSAILLVFVIQLAPREFMFALLYAQLLLLFVPGGWNRRLIVVFAIAYVYLLAVMAGVAPGAFLLKANGLL